jgi:phage tail tape-measure protein
MGFWRTIGRSVGRFVETVGEWTGSKTIKTVGQWIQSACDEVSRDTGKTDRYDKETARLEETKKINKILTAFALKLEKKADEIEKTAIKEAKVYFEKLIDELRQSDVDINVNKIERAMGKVERKIKGNLKRYISKRVSIDDSECLEILKMDEGYKKEIAMKKFSESVLRLGLKELIKDIKNIIKKQNDIITDAIEERLQDIKSNLEKEVEEFNLLEKSKLQTESEVDKLKNELIVKIQLSEACMDLLLMSLPMNDKT